MKSLSMSSLCGLTRAEYETLKFGEIPNVIYRRILYKFRQILGDKAEQLLAAHCEDSFKSVTNITGVNLWDCFFVYPD